MGRLETRYKVKLPVNLKPKDRVDNWHLQATTSNIGLGGAFFATDLTLPDGVAIRAEASIPGHGHVFLPGRVVRRDSSGFAIKFEMLNDESRNLLKKIIHEEIIIQEHCPVCHNYRGENNHRCPFCSHAEDQLAPANLAQPSYVSDKIFDPHEQIDLAMGRFMQDMAEIEEMCSINNSETDTLQKTDDAVRRFNKACGHFEDMVQDKEIIRRTQQQFRKKTDAIAAQSHFLHHARTWPCGYVGDHKIIEDIYRHVPLSEGLGFMLDRCFLDTELGKAVPARKDRMREIIEREIAARSDTLKILNIGCGSCRELVELADVIKKSEPRITCLDFDSAALDFAAERFGALRVLSHFNLRRYNALKMISPERNLREFGQQDLIYSIGLLDYMADDLLVRFIRAMYDLLEPHGKFIAVLKDSDRYETYNYHWLADWDAFYQRKDSESRELIRRAGIPEDNITVERDRTGVIIFYTLEKNID